MNNFKFPLVLFFSLVLLSTKCFRKEDIENRVMIDNQLDAAVFVVPSFNYPDTTLSFTSKDKIIANRNSLLILPNSSGRITNLSLCYKIEWERLVSSDTLLLFVFDRKVIENETWESISNHYMIEKRYAVSYNDLVSQKCRIVVN